MNAILSHSKDFKTTKKIENGDTLVVYKLNDDHFTFLGQPVTDIEVQSKNNLVILIAFPIEAKIMDAHQLTNSLSENETQVNAEVVMDATDDISEAVEDIGNSNKNDEASEVIDNAGEDTENPYKKALLKFVNENTPLTQKVIKYLNDNYQPVSSQPLCQFDCTDEWSSNYAQILIEKNNFIDDDDDKNTKVHIDQSLIIRSTLDQ
ncbi:MAG: hypothetical protein ACTIJ9_11195 [Aequorivita sp.]